MLRTIPTLGGVIVLRNFPPPVRTVDGWKGLDQLAATTMVVVVVVVVVSSRIKTIYSEQL